MRLSDLRERALDAAADPLFHTLAIGLGLVLALGPFIDQLDAVIGLFLDATGL